MIYFLPLTYSLRRYYNLLTKS